MGASNAALKLPSTDTGQAAEFLSVLSGGDRNATYSFQTFGEGVSSGDTSLTRVLHGTFAQHAAMLTSLNDRGAGIFVMVNEGDGRGRKALNVKRVRAVFADFDGAPIAPLDDIPLKPHLIVESSPDRWHAYWPVVGLALPDFGKLQAAIAKRFGSDGKVKDVSRVMRLPGFIHHKQSPFMTRIAEIRRATPYAEKDVAGLFLADHPIRPVLVERALIPEGMRNDTLFKMASGFVRRGLAAQAVNDRIQRVNAEQCEPPLGADEVDVICANASVTGSPGYTYLPHSVNDAPGFRDLSTAAVAILLAFFRKYDGHNNGKLGVPWSEFKGCHGMSSGGAYYRHLASLVDAGFLLKAHATIATQRGRVPAMYAIPEKYLPPSAKSS